jgi:hypothetical protein
MNQFVPIFLAERRRCEQVGGRDSLAATHARLTRRNASVPAASTTISMT